MKVSRSALRLLKELAELEDAGFISQGGTVLVQPGYDAGSMEAEIPPVVTYEGRRALSAGED